MCNLKSFGCEHVDVGSRFSKIEISSLPLCHRCRWRHSVFQHYCAVQTLHKRYSGVSILSTGQLVRNSRLPRETNFHLNRFLTANLTIYDSATERRLFCWDCGKRIGSRYRSDSPGRGWLCCFSWPEFLGIAFCCVAVRDIAVGRAAGGPRRWRRMLSTPLSVQRQVSD